MKKNCWASCESQNKQKFLFRTHTKQDTWAKSRARLSGFLLFSLILPTGFAIYNSLNVNYTAFPSVLQHNMHTLAPHFDFYYILYSLSSNST